MSINACRNTALGALFAIAFWGGGAIAAPITITGPANDFTINWSYSPVSGSTASATAAFDVTSLTSSELRINVQITNTSTRLANAGITSFGFNINPNATAATMNTFGGNDTVTDTDKFNAVAFGNLPAIAAIDVCVFAGNNCNGGPQNNLLGIGETDYFTLTIFGNFGVSPSVSFLDVIANTLYGGTGPFGIKFQTNLGSYEFTGNGRPPGGGDDPVPVPGVALLLGFGLLGLRKMQRSA